MCVCVCVWDTGGLSSSLRLMADQVYIRYYIIIIISSVLRICVWMQSHRIALFCRLGQPHIIQTVLKTIQEYDEDFALLKPE